MENTICDYCDYDFSDDDSDECQPEVQTYHRLLDSRYLLKYLLPTAATYDFPDWNTIMPSRQITLRNLLINHSWDDFFDIVQNKPYYPMIEQKLSKELESEQQILPRPHMLFNAFNHIDPENIKVVIIGQDPYPGTFSYANQDIPYATGLSFSVPIGSTVPGSLRNITANMCKYGHIDKDKTLDCLGLLAYQGCFLFNTALTTLLGKKKSHTYIWKSFTADLIEYINCHTRHVVFLVWGSDAHRLCLSIDTTKHHIITSSHPSPLSAHKTFKGKEYGYVKNEQLRCDKTYDSFNNTDHFGLANEYLRERKKTPILWNMI